MSDSRPTQTVETTGAGRHSRGRSIAAGICVVLAALLTTPAAVAFWGQRTLNDGQRYLDTVGPLVESPEVQDAIATKVVAAIEQQVDVEAILNEVFAGVITDRPRLQRLVGPLAGAINGLIEREVRAFVASDAFADLWVRVNTRAQQVLVRLLEGDETGAVSLQGDQVVLDVGEVIDQVKQRLVARGLTIVENVPIPEIDRQIVLLDAPQLRQARTIYAFANPLARWLIVVVVLLYLAALLLARRRPRMTVTIGVLLAANALLVAFALSVGRQLFIDKLAGSDFGPASSVFYDTLLGYLERGWKVIFWLGLILVVTGWFTGSNPPAPPSGPPCRAAWRPSERQWPTDQSAVPGAGSRPTPAGCGWPSACSGPSSCCGATTSRSPGCSGRWHSWSCSWQSSRSWSAPAARQATPARHPKPAARPAPTIRKARSPSGRAPEGSRDANGLAPPFMRSAGCGGSGSWIGSDQKRTGAPRRADPELVREPDLT